MTAESPRAISNKRTTSDSPFFDLNPKDDKKKLTAACTPAKPSIYTTSHLLIDADAGRNADRKPKKVGALKPD